MVAPVLHAASMTLAAKASGAPASIASRKRNRVRASNSGVLVDGCSCSKRYAVVGQKRDQVQGALDRTEGVLSQGEMAFRTR